MLLVFTILVTTLISVDAWDILYCSHTTAMDVPTVKEKKSVFL